MPARIPAKNKLVKTSMAGKRSDGLPNHRSFVLYGAPRLRACFARFQLRVSEALSSGRFSGAVGASLVCRTQLDTPIECAACFGVTRHELVVVAECEAVDDPVLG